MQATEHKRASPRNRTGETAYRRWLWWFLLGILLLLPIGIGIGFWQSRNAPSSAKQEPRAEAVSVPIREFQSEAGSVEGDATLNKSAGDPAARTASRNDEGLSQSQGQNQASGLAGGRTHLSSSSNDLIAISRITPALIPSPVYELATGPQKRFKPRNWLEIEVEFSSRQHVPDGAVFHFEAQVNGTLFTGDIAVAPIEKANNLLTVGYLNPSSLRRAFQAREPNYDSLRIGIMVVSGKETIGGASYEKTPISPAVEQQFEHTVRPKSDTPFAPLYWDRYVESATPSSEE